MTVYYSSQCPYVHQSVELLRKTCLEEGVDCTLIAVDTLEKAKTLPCVFNNWALFDEGRFCDGQPARCGGAQAAFDKTRDRPCTLNR